MATALVNSAAPFILFHPDEVTLTLIQMYCWSYTLSLYLVQLSVR